MALTQISTAGVKDDAVTSGKIPANAVGSSELADNAVDTAAIADQAVDLTKLPHGTSSNDGKFLRANNGADPTFETVSIPAGTTINNNADNRVITGSGTANTLNGESNVVIDSSGNVGIGTTSPQSILSAKVSASRQLDVIKDSGDDHLVLKSTAPDASYNMRSIELAGADVSFSTGASSGTSYTQRMRIDPSGNVGIGESDISNFGGTYKGLDVAYKGSGLSGRTDNPTFDMRSNIYYDGSNYKYGEGSTTAGLLSVGGAQLTFSNAPSGTAGATATVTQRMLINSTGGFEHTSGDNTAYQVSIAGAVRFQVVHSGGGNMVLSNPSSGNVTYSTSSDYRLKDNVTTINNALTTVKALKPYQFTWKHDSQIGQGFFAHEVLETTPNSQAALGTKDAVDSEDNPIYQQVDYSKLVPLLTAALQEAVAKIETLETKVAALEAA